MRLARAVLISYLAPRTCFSSEGRGELRKRRDYLGVSFPNGRRERSHSHPRHFRASPLQPGYPLGSQRSETVLSIDDRDYREETKKSCISGTSHLAPKKHRQGKLCSPLPAFRART